jgi:hypothetical protein
MLRASDDGCSAKNTNVAALTTTTPMKGCHHGSDDCDAHRRRCKGGCGPRLRSMTGEELLQHAAAVVRDRRRTYGEPELLFARVAERWSQVIGTKITPAQVALCLCDLKLARLTVDPRHLDSLVDLAGYTAVARELQR